MLGTPKALLPIDLLIGAKAETSAGMAYAEKKAAGAVLRAARNGQSAGGGSSLNDRTARA